MRLVNMAIQLLLIYKDLSRRVDNADGNFELYNFDQLWGSTALGFPGMGGSAMTTERTYVIISDNTAYVYFGSNFAYSSPATVALMDDISNQRMASVMESGRYKK